MLPAQKGSVPFKSQSGQINLLNRAFYTPPSPGPRSEFSVASGQSVELAVVPGLSVAVIPEGFLFFQFGRGQRLKQEWRQVPFNRDFLHTVCGTSTVSNISLSLAGLAEQLPFSTQGLSKLRWKCLLIALGPSQITFLHWGIRKGLLFNLIWSMLPLGLQFSASLILGVFHQHPIEVLDVIFKGLGENYDIIQVD